LIRQQTYPNIVLGGRRKPTTDAIVPRHYFAGSENRF
jgi:hypothetical protein